MTLEPISAEPPHRLMQPVMWQSWRDLTFLHWRCDPAAVRPLIPKGLALDLYDGAAWIGLVPFVITGLTRPGVREFPWISRFPETNVRTYVVDSEGRRGAWFFSLDAARLLGVIGARTLYALPYFWAKMSVVRDRDTVRYRSRRLAGPAAASQIEVTPGESIAQPDELETFLTARFRLYAVRHGRVLSAEVDHPSWPLRRARVIRLEETLVHAAGLPRFTEAPLVHFSDRVDVNVGAPHLIRPR